MEKDTKNFKLKNLFKTHPKVDKFYITSDEQVFIRKDHADAHANSLADKDIVSYSRKLFEQIDKIVSDKTASKGEGSMGKKAKEADPAKTAAAEGAKEPGAETDKTGTGESTSTEENKTETKVTE